MLQHAAATVLLGMHPTMCRFVLAAIIIKHSPLGTAAVQVTLASLGTGLTVNTPPAAMEATL
jgi:hypothetical protein